MVSHVREGVIPSLNDNTLRQFNFENTLSVTVSAYFSHLANPISNFAGPYRLTQLLITRSFHTATLHVILSIFGILLSLCHDGHEISF